MHLDLDRTDLSWLRRLARALVGEPHAADDLMQDTLLAASRRPDVQPRSLRAWLAGIARRLAARQVRDGKRRDRREAEAVAPTDDVGDPADLVARAELAERLANAARKLPEPMRSAVLLRFLDGLDVPAIATKTGKPDDTVRYRIRRGLELLRRDLGGSDDPDTSRRQCRALLLPLAGLTPTTPTAAAPLGLTLLTIMNAKNLTLAMLGLLLLATLTWWTQSDGEPTPAREEARTDTPAATANPEAPVVEVVAAPERTVATPTAPIAPASDAIVGTVVDQQGAPVAGASLSLRNENGGDEPASLARVTSDAAGRFELPRPQQSAELLARSNGFRREFTTVDPANQDEELVVVMRRGGELIGRVVDGSGRGVPDLDLLAYTEGGPVAHVSPTQSLLRANRANEGPATTGYEQCRARTDSEGNLRFTGLAEGKVRLRSLDPAWRIEQPATAAADGTFVLWTAAANYGVELSVVGSDGRPIASLARARFRFEAVTADGVRHKLGKWVGRGRDVVSFALTDECVSFPMSSIREVVFFGEVGDGTTWTPWRAEPLFDAGRVARVRVELPDTVPVLEQATPTATLELQVFGEDGAPWREEISVRWRTASARAEADSTTTAAGADGRHRLEVPAGKLELEVQQSSSSGSIAPWRGEVFATAGGLATATVRLPLGASAVITRPDGFDGTWYVRASYRQDEAEDWFGSWTYGTGDDELVLRAMKPAQWRFELRRSPDQDEPATVRIATMRGGERQTVSR